MLNHLAPLFSLKKKKWHFGVLNCIPVLVVSVVTVARNEAQGSVDNTCQTPTEKYYAIESVLDCACFVLT